MKHDWEPTISAIAVGVIAAALFVWIIARELGMGI